MQTRSILLAGLRIGEKIALSSGLVGLIFLGVIWAYHETLSKVLEDYRHLQVIYQAESDQAREIALDLLRASDAGKAFLLHRDEALIAASGKHLDDMLRRADKLGGIDSHVASAASQIIDLTRTYRASQEAIADAWRTKGLDHNSGLQGAFRDTAHRLQDLAASYQIGNLYINLLQIRRSEKDLGLRHEEQYRDKVLNLLSGFSAKVESSALPPEIKEALIKEISAYGRSFDGFADKAMAEEDIGGGKGPFRDAAHRIENLINGHYVPGMEVSVLELRRREKDYLLRLDPQYVDMVQGELLALRDQVRESAISEAEKSLLLSMLSEYERDFGALVQQNTRIEGLTETMKGAAAQIFALVDTTVSEAMAASERMTAEVNATAAGDTRIMLWLTVAAALLGALLVFLITRWITRPVLRMADFLDRLALEDPIERIPTVPGSRDEINAMAESVNKMADHKKRMLAWWKASLETMASQAEQQATESPVEARQAKEAMRNTLCDEMHGLAQAISERVTALSAEATPADTRQEAATAIVNAARTLDQRVEFLRH